MAPRRGAKIITRGPNTKYGRMKLDRLGGLHALSLPNLVRGRVKSPFGKGKI